MSGKFRTKDQTNAVKASSPKASKLEDARSYWNERWEKARICNLTNSLTDTDFVQRIKDKRVLDVGCGDLLVASMLSSPGSPFRLYDPFTSLLIRSSASSYTGLDVSDRVISNSKTVFPDSNFVNANATEIPFADNSFDVAVSVSTLGYLGRDIEKALKEIARVSSEGMLFDLPHPDMEFNRDVKREKLGDGILITCKEYPDLFAIDETGVKSLMLDVGFKPDEISVRTMCILDTEMGIYSKKEAVLVEALRK